MPGLSIPDGTSARKFLYIQHRQRIKKLWWGGHHSSELEIRTGRRRDDPQGDISESLSPDKPVPIPFRRRRGEHRGTAIIRAVASYYSITYQDLVSLDRHARVAFARQVAMWLCRARMGHSRQGNSLPVIGKMMGRDHSTITHGIQRVAALLECDEDVYTDVVCIMAMLDYGDTDENVVVEKVGNDAAKVVDGNGESGMNDDNATHSLNHSNGR